MLADQMYGFRKGQKVRVLDGDASRYKRWKKESSGDTGYVVRFDVPGATKGFVLITNRREMVEIIREWTGTVFNRNTTNYTCFWIKKEYLRPFCALNRDQR